MKKIGRTRAIKGDKRIREKRGGRQGRRRKWERKRSVCETAVERNKGASER